MITKDNIDDGLPISVIVPLSNHRKDFFYNMVYPLLEANNPNEIIVNNDVGLGCVKRNEGFKNSTQPYVFFCDDDILLPAKYLKKLYDKIIELKKIKKIGYVYTGYQGIVMNPSTHPFRGNFKVESNHFDGASLRRNNFISTMSLMKREVFPQFDETLTRFQDWDMYLTMLENGVEGVFVNDIKFYAYYLDDGITSNTNSLSDAQNKIITKHKLR